MSRTCMTLFVALMLVAPACDSSSDSPAGSGGPPALPSDIRSPVDIHTAPPPRGGWLESACALPKEQLVWIARGYYPGRSPEITMVPREPNFFGSFTANSHSGPWDYVQRVPLVLWGPGYIKSSGDVRPEREVRNLDIVPTIADLVGHDFPIDRPGRSLRKALVPETERPAPPKLVVTVVWDGGGVDVLDQWPNAWPNLERLAREGTSFADAVVGSSPPVTPASHSSIGTGAFPDQHGIVDIPLRINGKMAGSWPNKSPKFLLIPSFADLYDQETGNAAQIGMVADHNWHLGMIGHGSYLEGGDKDFGAILNDAEGITTNYSYYALPDYLKDVPGFDDDLRTIDASDGEVDEQWMGNDVLKQPRLARETPAMTLYETRIIKALAANEGFGDDEVTDLLFINYKQIDYVGHRFNMVTPEMQQEIHYSDQELGDLVAFFNQTVGRDNWVLAVTADHGSTPLALSTKAWPIGMDALKSSIADHFEVGPSELFDDERVTGMWTDKSALTSTGITTEEIADYMLTETIGDNVVSVDELPEGYDQRLDEPIFSAVFPTRQLPKILDCAGVRL